MQEWCRPSRVIRRSDRPNNGGQTSQVLGGVTWYANETPE